MCSDLSAADAPDRGGLPVQDAKARRADDRYGGLVSYVIGEAWNADDLDWQAGGEEGCEYALSNDAYTWSDARTYAQSRGGDLAGCLEGEECNWLFSVFHPGTEDFTQYWVGGLQDELGEEPDELWEWVFTGYPIYPEEDPWLPGAPNDGDPGENCTTSGGGPSHPECRDYDVAALVYNYDAGTVGLVDGFDDIDEETELRAIIQRDADTGICTDGLVDYQRTFAWEFRYDGARQRYLRSEVDPDDFTMITEEWSDYDEDWVYADFVLDTGVPGGARTIRDYLADDRFGHAHADSSTHGVWDGEAYYHTDQIGSTRLMTDGTPQVVREYVYSAFGQVYETSGSATTRYRYAGRWGYQSHDDFPFLHVGARYYDPETGRFLQRDLIGIAGGLNPYVYVLNKPTTELDPSGLIPHGTGTVIHVGKVAKDGAEVVAKGAQCWRNVAHRNHIVKCHGGLSKGEHEKTCKVCKKLKRADNRKKARERNKKIYPKFSWLNPVNWFLNNWYE